MLVPPIPQMIVALFIVSERVPLVDEKVIHPIAQVIPVANVTPPPLRKTCVTAPVPGVPLTVQVLLALPLKPICWTVLVPKSIVSAAPELSPKLMMDELARPV